MKICSLLNLMKVYSLKHRFLKKVLKKIKILQKKEVPIANYLENPSKV